MTSEVMHICSLVRKEDSGSVTQRAWGRESSEIPGLKSKAHGREVYKGTCGNGGRSSEDQPQGC